MNGVLNIDKPPGMTSHDVVYRVRKIAGQKRIGHAGTLDPDATGVLLVCLGTATRLSDLLAGEGKVYDAVLRLGVTTSTEDASGEILSAVDASHITQVDIETVLPQFVGSIEQIPPMVSAVHHEGHRLYDLARQGITVERASRTIQIDSIELLDFKSGDQCCASLRIACGKGTYIRTLCADIGAVLGIGGHMANLRRTGVGRFHVDDAVRLDDLTKELILERIVTPSQAVSFLPQIELDEIQLADVQNGKRILSGSSHPEGTVVRLEYEGVLIALAIVQADGQLQPQKVFGRSD